MTDAIKQWTHAHLRIIRQLVEEPKWAEARPGEPVLQVQVIGAELGGGWPDPRLAGTIKPFVRHYIDGECVGETTINDNPWQPRWGKIQGTFLTLPRGATCSQFEILDGRSRIPLFLGDVAFATETLWHAAENLGRYSIQMPLCFEGRQVGVLYCMFKMWDGMPLEDDSFLTNLGGTLAGALEADPLIGTHGRFSDRFASFSSIRQPDWTGVNPLKSALNAPAPNPFG
mmetsp:Transcript_58694/g.102732  ORF Transcript_58694/g.102732 Transcript_58694/m.102732 type:complete len:228 (-) Transcript_58694:56-739(-)